MQKEQQKEILMNFKKCCRLYNSWQSELQNIEIKLKRVSHEQEVAVKKKEIEHVVVDFGTIDKYKIYANEYIQKLMLHELNQNINYIDRIFEKIDKLYGSDAKTIIWQLYVEGQKEKDIEASLGVSRRTLYRKLDEWLVGALIGREPV